MKKEWVLVGLVVVVITLLIIIAIKKETTTTTTTTTNPLNCPEISSCLKNPETMEYEIFSGCGYNDAIAEGWEVAGIDECSE